MRYNSPPTGHRYWQNLPRRVLRGVLLGLTLGLALSTMGLVR